MIILKKLKLFTVSILMLTSVPSFASQEVIKVGMSGRYYPFTFTKQGKLQGFEVDLWNEIGERNNYKIEFVTSNFSGLFGLLETGRIDTISNQIAITNQRKKSFLFSLPYVVDGAQIVVKKGNNTIHSTQDLSGKTVGVNLGSNYNFLLKALPNEHDIHIKTYDTGIVQDVILGRTDAFIMDRLSSIALIYNKHIPLQLAGKAFSKVESAWPFIKNKKGEQLQKQVSNTLLKMRQDGTLKSISYKWFSSNITE